MIFKGYSITQINDNLQEISVADIINEIRNPSQEFRRLIENLRVTKIIDENKYRIAKRQLPYFVCARFHPLIRRKENFVSITYFVLDIDHIFKGDIDIQELKNDLAKDTRVVSFFESPSGDGLKIIFKLSQKCVDSGLFSGFYKLFTKEFGLKYNCMNALDLKTFDVTRACFLSLDAYVYFNEKSTDVEISDYVNLEDSDGLLDDLKDVKTLFDELEKEQKKEVSEVNDDVIQLIKEKLNPRLSVLRESKNYYVPAELDTMIPYLKTELEKFEMQLLDVSSIQYGKKLKIVAGRYWAEINLFYGKRGYSIVKTTKSGSHTELADLAVKAIQSIIFP